MTLLALSSVTKSLVKLLEERVGQLLLEHFTPSTDWPLNTKLSVLPQPSDEVEKSSGNVLGLYLYHTCENGHFKNHSPFDSDQAQVRYQPMGLDLYYQLSAHSDQQDKIGTYREQLMLGLAVKALHDYPLIDESTEINGKKILDGDLIGSDSRFRIVLQPVAHDEAVNYWTAGSSPLRLAAYYQVSIILLEPEEPTLRAGRVLTYGVHSFVGGAPRLDGSRNVVSYSLPDQVGKHEIELRPAQAPPAPLPPGQTPIGCEVTFSGTNLGDDNTHLLLKHARWEEPIQVDTAWDIEVRNDRVTAVVRQTVTDPRTGITEDILPGTYAAVVKVLEKRIMPDKKVREFEHLSNEVPFAITPRIDKVETTGGVTTVTGYLFEHTAPSLESVQVYVGSEQLAIGTAAAPGPGEFVVSNASTLKLRPPANPSSTGQVPLRIFVNGAESPPRWIKV